jgi:hypothetical protein
MKSRRRTKGTHLIRWHPWKSLEVSSNFHVADTLLLIVPILVCIAVWRAATEVVGESRIANRGTHISEMIEGGACYGVANAQVAPDTNRHPEGKRPIWPPKVMIAAV